jgi:2-iminobutanoate/2-iminopropanoate deaminase
MPQGVTTMKSAVSTDNAPGAIGPYSQGIRAGNLVFVSGQTPVNPENGSIPEGITAQTEQGLKNVQAIVEESGCSMDDVVEVSVFLKNMNDFAEMNEVYKTFFKPPYPTRAAVEVARLPLDVLVEIKAVASAG